jgi:hypothetical protein
LLAAGREARRVSAADQRHAEAACRGHFNDSDVMEVALLALTGLVQQTADVA